MEARYFPQEASVEYHVDRKIWQVCVTYILLDPPHGCITIPAGEETDLASTPHLLWSLGLAPYELSVEAALFHDYLYRRGGVAGPGFSFSRKQADQLFLWCMLQKGVPAWKARAAYHAVRLFASRAWKDPFPYPPNQSQYE